MDAKPCGKVQIPILTRTMSWDPEMLRLKHNFDPQSPTTRQTCVELSAAPDIPQAGG